MVAVNATDDEIVKYIKKKKYDVLIDDSFYSAISCAGRGRAAMRGNFSVIRFNGYRKSPYWYGVVAHEAFHLAEMLFDRIGIQHHADYSGEAYAYFIQSTVRQILEGMQK